MYCLNLCMRVGTTRIWGVLWWCVHARVYARYPFCVCVCVRAYVCVYVINNVSLLRPECTYAYMSRSVCVSVFVVRSLAHTVWGIHIALAPIPRRHRACVLFAENAKYNTRSYFRFGDHKYNRSRVQRRNNFATSALFAVALLCASSRVWYKSSADFHAA